MTSKDMIKTLALPSRLGAPDMRWVLDLSLNILTMLGSSVQSRPGAQ